MRRKKCSFWLEHQIWRTIPNKLCCQEFILQALKGAPMGPVRIGLSKPSGQVTIATTPKIHRFSQDVRTGSSVPPCSTSTAPSDLQTDTPTLSCSSVSLETFSPTPSVLTGGQTCPSWVKYFVQVPCRVALQAGVPCPRPLAAQCFPR